MNDKIKSYLKVALTLVFTC